MTTLVINLGIIVGLDALSPLNLICNPKKILFALVRL